MTSEADLNFWHVVAFKSVLIALDKTTIFVALAYSYKREELD